jgi:hypothetical protein
MNLLNLACIHSKGMLQKMSLLSHFKVTTVNICIYRRYCQGVITIYTCTDQISMWKNKYEALAKLYSQLRQEHLDLLGKYKSLQLQANNAKEANEKLDTLQAEMRAKNIELADLIRERDRAKNELTRLQGVSKITMCIFNIIQLTVLLSCN